MAEVEAWSSRVKLRSVTAITPGGGLGVDRAWTGVRGNPSAMCAFMALSRGIVAGQTHLATERASFNALLLASQDQASAASRSLLSALVCQHF